jgi:hypothetical protein
MIAELKRLEGTDGSTIGVLLFDKVLQCFTLENRDWQNQRFLSCIPPGNYFVNRTISPRFGTTFEITDVPGRSHILFHKGNTAEETDGCVLVGTHIGWIDGVRAVLSSRKAFDQMMFTLEVAKVEQFKLVISEDF